MIPNNPTRLLYTPRNGLWRLIALLMLSLSVCGGAIQAQTETPTPTSTATETAIPTPDVLQVWMLPTTLNELGTPEPTRWVGVAYEANAGDVAIITLLAAILFALVAASVIWLFPKKREQS